MACAFTDKDCGVMNQVWFVKKERKGKKQKVLNCLWEAECLLNRCVIPECEDIKNATYWNSNAAYINLTKETLGEKVFLR